MDWKSRLDTAKEWSSEQQAGQYKYIQIEAERIEPAVQKRV